MPETPCSSANTASSAVKMPLIRTGNAVIERSQSTVSQFTGTWSGSSSSTPTKLATTSGGGGIGTQCLLLPSPLATKGTSTLHRMTLNPPATDQPTTVARTPCD